MVRTHVRHGPDTALVCPGEIGFAMAHRPLPKCFAPESAGAVTLIPLTAPQLGVKGGQRRADLPPPYPRAERRSKEILVRDAWALECAAGGEGAVARGP